LDEVEQWQTGSLVFLRNRNHETQVGLHELPLRTRAIALGLLQFAAAIGRDLRIVLLELGGGFLAAFDRLGQANFVVLGEECVLTDVGEVEPNEIFFVPINPVFRHFVSSCLSERGNDTDGVKFHHVETPIFRALRGTGTIRLLARPVLRFWTCRIHC